MSDYLLYPNLFTPEQCKQLVTLSLTVPPDDTNGIMHWQSEEPERPEVRMSRLRWLRRADPRFAFAFEAMDRVLDDGDKKWGFDTAGDQYDAIQFVEYNQAREAHYDWHNDDFGRPFDRLLSAVVQLSEPEYYEGGRLELDVPAPPPPDALSQRGTAIVFPSTTRHRVTHTTRGTRYSAVAWRSGKRPITNIERCLAVPDFFPQAQAMRDAYHNFFVSPDTHGPQHQVFDMWYVPEIYCYLRTSAERVLGVELVNAFVAHLRNYVSRFNLQVVTQPYLSIYTNGMFQEVHNDAKNGVYGYVFSLTDWANRRFDGGETLLARPGVFDALEPREPRGRGNFYEEFPAHFGQLLLFDDRIPHYVPTIRGTMSPLHGRVVLHGHIQT